ncbi:MAG: hypothetical protein PHU40_00095 [Sulfurimonas sp.]|nr:hypothetical protein [Sulfurimonas sp.]
MITFILQNDGKLSKNKKEKYFEKLTEDELKSIENSIQNHFKM